MVAPFSIKTVQIRECTRCKTQWGAEDIHLRVGDAINFMKVTIAHCPVCSESFASEIDRPQYRKTGKRIR